jgi:TetR/AcrR family transcriptional repressor of nem operon
MRPKTFQREEVIAKAMGVFWRKGYTATSSDDLLQAMGLGEGSFYREFKGGKRELFEMVINQFREKHIQRFKHAVEVSSNPKAIIKFFFRKTAEVELDEHKKGCLIGNTVAEMTFLDLILEKNAVVILKEIQNVLCKSIDKAKVQGQISNKCSSKIIALQLITFWNGLNITRRMYPDKIVLLGLIDKELEILD